MADTHIEDGLHEMVDQLLYNRRLANTHLQRAEAILSTVYPDLENREPWWLDAAALKQYIISVFTERRLHVIVLPTF